VCFSNATPRSPCDVQTYHNDDWLRHQMTNLFFSAGLSGDVTARMRARRPMGVLSGQPLRQCLERPGEGWTLSVCGAATGVGHGRVAAIII
jgi:hypothetical protein